MSKFSNEEVIEYYDVGEQSYRDIWHLDSALSMHYGFWEKGVSNLKEALIKEIEVMANLAQITQEDKVLDAGCGVGGSSIYLAEKIGCQVIGITLSQYQVKKATQSAKERNVDSLVSFQEMDFHQISFEDNSFDVIWFLESFCYSDDIESLLKDVYRLLKPNGRLVIGDGFSSKSNFSKKEKQIMDKWLNSWAIDTVVTPGDVVNTLESIQFKNISSKDYTKEIKRSAFILYLYSQAAFFKGWLYRLVGKKYGNQVTINNTIGAKYQYIALKKKLWEYAVITAVK